MMKALKMLIGALNQVMGKSIGNSEGVISCVLVHHVLFLMPLFSYNSFQELWSILLYQGKKVVVSSLKRKSTEVESIS